MPRDLTPQVMTFRVDGQTFMQYVDEQRREKGDGKIRWIESKEPLHDYSQGAHDAPWGFFCTDCTPPVLRRILMVTAFGQTDCADCRISWYN
jgi:hypothetical protein